MNAITTLFHSLEGRWTVQRTITGSHEGRFQGHARFEKVSSTPFLLRYSEEGSLTTSQQEFASRQEYLYRLENNTILVYFQTQQLFHILQFDRSFRTATATHQCEQDAYCAKYEFEENGDFSLAYEVTGPKKNYQIHTIFRRSLNI